MSRLSPTTLILDKSGRARPVPTRRKGAASDLWRYSPKILPSCLSGGMTLFATKRVEGDCQNVSLRMTFSNASIRPS
jgi:hypothetical protein